MILPYSKLIELRETGWTVFNSPSPETTKAATRAIHGKVILTTRVEPRVDAKAALASDREMELHTDHPRVHWIIWHCVRQSSEGGISLLKDARKALHQLNPTNLRALRETTMGTHKVFPGDKERYPVLRRFGDTPDWVYYTPWFRREGADCNLDAFAKELDKVETIQVRLLPGQALAINNARMLHGRSAIGGDRDRIHIR